MKSYSQMGQDLWVAEIFHNMTYGYFLEVGAGNGIDLSNTYALETELLWDGLCIEPNSRSYELLKANRRCKVSDQFILKDGVEVDFIEYGDTGAHQDYFSSTIPYDSFTNVPEISKNVRRVTTKSLHTLMINLNLPSMIHYMSLDVEGNELPILEEYFVQVTESKALRRIVSISLEHNFRNPDRQNIRNLLEANDYVFVKELLQDDLYVHAAFAPMLS